MSLVPRGINVLTLRLTTEMFTTLHDSRGEYDAPAKFRMPSTKSIVGAMEQVRVLRDLLHVIDMRVRAFS